MRDFLIITILCLGLTCVALLTESRGHDSWISKEGRRNTAGEWCCGDDDCHPVFGVVRVSLPSDGYRLPSGEFVHSRDTQFSPDGLFWRCHRPDKTTRCFFVPIPAGT